MLTHYLILDLPSSADDETIRRRYLELVKRYSPESHPLMFRRITAAYDALKDERTRIRASLFKGMEQSDWEHELTELAEARRPRRKRVTLSDLIEASGKTKNRGKP
jgi:DnaJ-class molecular chaperone